MFDFPYYSTQMKKSVSKFLIKKLVTLHKNPIRNQKILLFTLFYFEKSVDFCVYIVYYYLT